MQIAIKITADAGFDAATPLVGPFPRAGANGVITIHVASPSHAGIIDPDLFGTTGANQTLLLQSFLIELGAPGGATDRLEVVDEDARHAFTLAELAAQTVTFADRGWVIPVGYMIRVRGPGPAVLRMNLWPLTDALHVCSLARAPAA